MISELALHVTGCKYGRSTCTVTSFARSPIEVAYGLAISTGYGRCIASLMVAHSFVAIGFHFHATVFQPRYFHETRCCASTNGVLACHQRGFQQAQTTHAYENETPSEARSDMDGWELAI